MAATSQITKAIIHPFLGIARVGNSKASGSSGYFVGPEVDEPAVEPAGFYRDKDGALKRQAARFRIYGLDSNNNVVKEITADDAQITWQVHLCNRKGHWYEFQIAQDIPEARSMPTPALRNIRVADRDQLVIDPGERQIQGRDMSGPTYRFDTGRFLGHAVELGEVRTDELGRLLVLGGYGKAGSVHGKYAHSSTNNDGWYDDTSDGPVRATVVLDGRRIEAVSAWVAVAPPNYAPALKSIRTMWDRIEEIRQDAMQALKLPAPIRKPSFMRDIRPIFQRLSMLQWVNAGFAGTFGWKGPYDFTSPGWLERLADPSTDLASVELRRNLFLQFRRTERDGLSPLAWPWIYGEAINVLPRTPNAYATLGRLQMANLEAWVAGDFVADFDPAVAVTKPLEKLPLAEQRTMLDRAAMDFCVADVFEPGIELPWIVRDRLTYEGYRNQEWMFPRIKPAAADFKEPDYGVHLDYSFIRTAGQVPGSVTQWLGVPWQADHASCLSAYSAVFGAFVPALWPARVPNHVLTEAAYAVVMDENASPADRRKAFRTRTPWQRSSGGVEFARNVNAIAAAPDHLGLVTVRQGPQTGEFPDMLYVDDRARP